MIAEKTGPSDGSYNDIYNNDNSEEEEKKAEKDELYKKEMEELEKAGEEMEEREAEKIKRAKKNRESREESGGKKKTEMNEQIVEKKIYSHEKEGGIFTKGKATNYSQKINKALRKVHGVSLAKKKEMTEIIKNCASRKTTITEKEVGDILSKLKYGNYTGSGSSGINRMLKNMEKEGVDLKSYKKELKKKFSRRDIDKFKIALGGGKDPRKHNMRSGLNKSANKASRSGSTSPNRIGRGF